MFRNSTPFPHCACVSYDPQEGTKGPFLRSRCMGTVRARTQMLINQSMILRANSDHFHTHTALNDEFYNRYGVFTAQYELNLQIYFR